jgi:hypothetical protein
MIDAGFFYGLLLCLMPLASIFQACSCCSSPCGGCTAGTEPSQFQVVITGVANTACLTCTGENNTFILDRYDATDAEEASRCFWVYAVSGICTHVKIMLYTQSNAAVQVYFSPFGGITTGVSADVWLYAGAITCNTISGLSIPVSGSGNCNIAGSTCTVTAL